MSKHMTQTQYAKHRGISQPRVSKMVRNGQIPASCLSGKKGRKLIDSERADAALVGSLDRIINNGAKHDVDQKQTTAKQAGTDGMTLARAQQIQAQYKAAKLKLEYEQLSGKLIEAATVETETFNFARQVRDAILAIPEKISAELVSCTDVHEMNEKLTGALSEALEELSR